MRWCAGYPVVVWQADRPWLSLSSGVHGGGLGERWWVLNSTVGSDYNRTDPGSHVAGIADFLLLSGSGTGLLTAVDVRYTVTGEDAGVHVSVSTGVGHPTWAAAPAEAGVLSPAASTINLICWLPVRLTAPALVNAIATVTEAKTQALISAGVPGTGTATDSIVLLCPTDGPGENFGGPRSQIGAPLARAVHAAVTAGLKVPDPVFRGQPSI
ncbi:adenosylcobinamide amidohydrolase [Pseudonocardiaceae bacterium YIM PH 21723]|nr:adenosylcobinamide amidohydrolase [Pseudonocardiaceae bacterium YIM PH 21723]